MNLLDRFLSVQPVARRHLQLLGTVCMFIAAKLKCSPHFSAETLVIYTANSITIEQLLAWEQLVMQRLRWDVQAVLAVDMVPHLLARIDLLDKHSDEFREYLSNFICLCATEFKFSVVPASMIAASCLYLTLKHTVSTLSPSLEFIHSLLGNAMDFECLLQCVEQIEDLIRAELKISSVSMSDRDNTPEQQQQQHQQQQQQQITVSSSC